MKNYPSHAYSVIYLIIKYSFDGTERNQVTNVNYRNEKNIYDSGGKATKNIIFDALWTYLISGTERYHSGISKYLNYGTVPFRDI